MYSVDDTFPADMPVEMQGNMMKVAGIDVDALNTNTIRAVVRVTDQGTPAR